MQLSVIILNYNVRFFLEQCVLSVQKALSTIDGEIIVIDNHSSDDSCEMMKQLFPNIKLIENKENLGFPKGNNIGVAQAQGEFICILNLQECFTRAILRINLSQSELVCPPLTQQHINGNRIGHDFGIWKVLGFLLIIAKSVIPKLRVLITDSGSPNTFVR